MQMRIVASSFFLFLPLAARAACVVGTGSEDYATLGYSCSGVDENATDFTCACDDESGCPEYCDSVEDIVYDCGAEDFRSLLACDAEESIDLDGSSFEAQEMLVVVNAKEVSNGQVFSNLRSRIFGVESRLVLTSMTVEGGYSPNSGYGGGCVLLGIGATLEAEDVSFRNCWSVTEGGAIAAYGSATISLVSCLIERAYAGVDGGCVYAAQNSVMTASSTWFRDSTAGIFGDSGYGGGIYATGSTEVTLSSGSLVYNCSVYGSGGGVAVFFTSYFSLFDSVMRTCYATASGGGAALGGTSTVWFDSDSVVSNCVSISGSGGAVAVLSSANADENDWVLVTNSLVYGCHADSFGGVLSSAQSNSLFYVVGSTITNSSAGNGGCVYSHDLGTVFVENVTFQYCFALDGDGGAMMLFDDSSTVMSSCSVKDCYADGGAGGGVYGNLNQDFEVVNGTVFDTCLSNGFGGGGIHIFGGAMRVSDVEFFDCVTSGGGGAIDGYTGVTVSVDDVRISDCSGANGGGGVRVRNSPSARLDHTTIDRCDGTAVHIVFGGSFVATETTSITNSVTGTNGGAVWLGQAGTLEFRGQATGNVASLGGALYVDTGSTATLDGAILTSNIAQVSGGAIATAVSATVIVSDALVESNVAKAEDGGGVMADDSSRVVVTASTFRNNSAPRGSGGALYIDNSVLEVSTGECEWLTFDLDWSGQGAVATGVWIVIYSEATNDVLDERGVEMYMVPEIGIITSYSFCLKPGEYRLEGVSETSQGWGPGTIVEREVSHVGCSMSTSGSHICNTTFTIDESPVVANVLFDRNTALRGGAVGTGSGSNLHFAGGRFFENAATISSAIDGGGGAINVGSLSTFNATWTTFVNNTAQSNGGGVYAGLLSEATCDRCRASGNVANLGGGFVAFESVSDALLVDCDIEENRAAEGGAVLVMDLSGSAMLTLRNSSFIQNFAEQGGALTTRTASVVAPSSIFIANQASGSGGAMALFGESSFKEGASSTCVRVFFDWRDTYATCNIVEQGSTCDNFADTCEILESEGYDCSGCACNNNILERYLELSFSSVDGSIVLMTNLAPSASAFGYRTVCDLEPGEYTLRAVDVLGSGWFGGTFGVYLPHSGERIEAAPFEGFESELLIFTLGDGTSSRYTSFQENVADVAGGVAYIDDEGDGVDAAPNITDATGNVAKYGDIIGGPPRTLNLSTSQIIAESGERPDKTITCRVYDSYGQQAVAGVQEGVARVEADVQMTGETVAFDENGDAILSELTVTSAPGSTIPITVSTTLSSVIVETDIEAVVDLRECVPGEYETSDACVPCEPTTYSFSPDEPCRRCEPFALCAGRASLIPEQGYWRSVKTSSNVRRCPYFDYCNSKGIDIYNSSLGPDAQCSENHEGPLCATCRSGYNLDPASGRCYECKHGERVRIAVGVAVFIFVVLLLVFLASSSDSFKSILCFDIFLGLGEFFHDNWEDVQSVLKVLVVFFQITGLLSRGFPSVHLPPIFIEYQRRIAVFSFDLATIFTRACIGNFDYLDMLVGSTLCPLIVVALVLVVRYYLLCRPGKSEESKDAVRTNAAMLLLVFSYLIMTSVSRIVIRTLQCDNDFKDASDEPSPYYRDEYLYADYEIRCDELRYRLHYWYAILMILVYPVGIPLSYLLYLLSLKKYIAPSDVRALAQNTLTNAERREREIRGTISRGSSSISQYRAATKEKKADLWRESHELAQLYLDQEDASRFQRERTVAIGEALILTTRELNETAGSFLFREFDSSCWYFEVLECGRRIVLTCAFPVTGFRSTDSFGQYALGMMIALFFAALYGHLRPFASWYMNAFANVMQSILVLNFFCLLVMYADQQIEDDTLRSGIDSKYFGGFLIFSNCVLAPIASCITILFETGAENFVDRGMKKDDNHDEQEKVDLEALEEEKSETDRNKLLRSQSSCMDTSSQIHPADSAEFDDEDLSDAESIDGVLPEFDDVYLEEEEKE